MVDCVLKVAAKSRKAESLALLVNTMAPLLPPLVLVREVAQVS